MLAILQNELVLYGIIAVLVLGIAIHKFYGLGKFIRLFTGSGERVKTARAKTVAQKKADDAAAAAE